MREIDSGSSSIVLVDLEYRQPISFSFPIDSIWHCTKTFDFQTLYVQRHCLQKINWCTLYNIIAHDTRHVAGLNYIIKYTCVLDGVHQPMLFHIDMWRISTRSIYIHVCSTTKETRGCFRTWEVHKTARFVMTTVWHVQVWQDARWHKNCLWSTPNIIFQVYLKARQCPDLSMKCSKLKRLFVLRVDVDRY